MVISLETPGRIYMSQPFFNVLLTYEDWFYAPHLCQATLANIHSNYLPHPFS